MNTTLRCTLPILSSLVMIAVSAAQNAPAPLVEQPSIPPTVTGALEHSRSVVFDTPKQSCNSNDIPDAMARAFRDSKGTVHLVAASSQLFQSIGPTLEIVTHSCDVGHDSANDPHPADFNDQTWIDSFYTFDGKTIAGLTHTEYHGWAHPGRCAFTNGYNGCEYDSDTYSESNDGGYHFNSPEAPKNFLAGVPFKYVHDAGPSGYSVDSNIIERDGWCYAMVTSWQWPAGCSGTTGPNRCITPNGGGPIRTQDVFDPSSWRGWNGKDFSLSFVDPYPGPVEERWQHVYTPVPYMDVVTGINVLQPANLVVAVLWNPWSNEYGEKGFYLSTSNDLVHWTKPTLVATLDQFHAQEPKGNWSYAYFSLIDPDAPDLSFSIIGDHPYLYYVRFNSSGSNRICFASGLI